MRISRLLSVVFFVFLLAVTACSARTSNGEGTLKDPSTENSGQAAASTQTSTTALSTADEQPSAGAQLGLPGMELLTPVSGSGTRPILEWTEVSGADHYLVSVKTAEGNGYWAWRTESTSVPVGGLPRLNEQAAGPRIVAGMTWSVIALDESGAIIAASNHRPIAP